MEGWFRRTCRFLMSLSSISGGNFTSPNINKYHRGFAAFLSAISDFPELFTDEFRSISMEFELLWSFVQSRDRLFLMSLVLPAPLFDRVTGLCSFDNDSDRRRKVVGFVGFSPVVGVLGGDCSSLKGMSFPQKMMSSAGHMSELRSLKNSKKSGASARDREVPLLLLSTFSLSGLSGRSQRESDSSVSS